MIDNAALAVYPFRTAPFKLGDDLDYHWEARTDGGATLVRDMDRMFYGAIITVDGRWVIERGSGDTDTTIYHSRDAAFYALAAKVSERNAEYAFNMAEFDRRHAEREAG